MMEDATFEIGFEGAILEFEGCKLIGVSLDETLEREQFTDETFIDSSGNLRTIEIVHVELCLNGDGSTSPGVQLQIDGEALKSLEAFKHFDGTTFLELTDDDDE